MGDISISVESQIERMKLAAQVRHDTELATFLGSASNTLSSWKKRESVPFEYIEAVANKTGVSIEWLLGRIGDSDRPVFRSELGIFSQRAADEKSRDESESYRNIPAKRADPHEGGFSSDQIPPSVGSEFALIPQRDVDLSAGPGAFAEHEPEIGRLAFRRDWLNKLGLDPSTCVLVRVRGDSMEPTLRNGSLVLVKTAGVQPAEDGIYALMLDGGLVVKRLQRGFGGALTVRSDNPNYGPIELTPDQVDELHIVGRVLWAAAEI